MSKTKPPQVGSMPLLASISPTSWEIEEGAYTWKRGEWSVWQAGARGDGQKKIACWINNGADAVVIQMAPAMLQALETIRGIEECNCDPETGRCVMCLVREIAERGLAGQRLSG